MDGQQPEEELTFVAEADRIQERIAELCLPYPEPVGPDGSPDLTALLAAESTREHALEKAKILLMPYQEQPELLNPHMAAFTEPLLGVLFEYVKNEQPADNRLYWGMRMMHALAKIRGPKSVGRYFPHEAAHLDQVFWYLKTFPTKPQPDTVRELWGEQEIWQTKYVLLLWMGIIVLVPFSFEVVSSERFKGRLVEDIMDYCREALSDPGPLRDAAAHVLGRTLVRPDTKGHLLSFLGWCRDTLQASANGEAGARGEIQQVGVLNSVATILKSGKREEIMPAWGSLFDAVTLLIDPVFEEGEASLRMTLQAKLLIKVYQRLALCLLPPHKQHWHYSRGTKELGVNNTADQTAPAQQVVDEEELDISEDQEEKLQEIIGRVTTALEHRDTIVRWSGAKGVGRICARLTKDASEEVVQHVIDMCFGDLETENSDVLHGGCLAIAELARRGCLLPDKLSCVVEIVEKCLVYSFLRGTCSVGAQVRDAACYVCWAFARAFQPADVEGYVMRIARQLVCVAVFDREVQVRRAAAAAFQESVGRLGSFPHGIDITQEMNYFTLATYERVFTEVAPKVAEYNEYGKCMLSHLVYHTVVHWDQDLRPWAARAIGLLASRYPDLAVEEMVPKLLKGTDLISSSADRHGSLLAISEILTQLATSGQIDKLPEGQVADMWQIVPSVEAKQLYAHAGGTLTRMAVCEVIRSLANSGIKVPTELKMPTGGASAGRQSLKARMAAAQSAGKGEEGKPVAASKEKTVPRILESLDGHLKNHQQPVQEAAASALRAFAEKCCAVSDLFGKLVPTWVEKLATSNPGNVRRGSSLALGALPPQMVRESGKAELVLNGLVAATKLEEEEDMRDSESRQRAVEALVLLTPAWSPAESKICFECLLSCLEDYETNEKGDVGSSVRLAAMDGLSSLLKALAKSQPAQLKEVWVQSIGALLKQAMERINKVRQAAGAILQDLASDDGLMALSSEGGLECWDSLQEAITKAKGDQPEALDWSAPDLTFPALAPVLLPKDPLFRPMLEGIVLSAGGLSVHVANAAIDCLSRFSALGAAESERMLSGLIAILTDNKGSERVVIPTLITLDKLLCLKGLFDTCPSSLAYDLSQAMRAELRVGPVARDVHRSLRVAPVVCGLLRFIADERVREEIMPFLMLLLGSVFPKVRGKAASSFSTFLDTDQILGLTEDEKEDIQDLLAPIGRITTAESRKKRDEISGILKLPAKKPAPAAE